MRQKSELRQRLQLEHKVNVMMLQTLTMLQMTNASLSDYVRELSLGNPLLDWDPNWQRHLEKRLQTTDHVDVFQNHEERSPKEILYDEISLQEWTDAQKQHARLFVDSCNDKGLLAEPYEAWLRWAGLNDDTMAPIIAALSRLAPGIPGNSIAACLANQVSEGTLTHTLVNDELVAIANGNLSEIALKYDVSEAEVKDAVLEIQGLQPYPFFQMGRGKTKAQAMPDLHLRFEDTWQITLFDDVLGAIQVDLHALDHLLGTPDVDRFVDEKKKEVEHLLFSIEERNKTLMRCASALAKRQDAYLQGKRKRPLPLLQKELAKDIGVHPSTISRAIRDKVMDTPRGLVPMEACFPKVMPSGQERYSPKDVMLAIEALLEEHPEASDQKLMQLLEEKGIHIARRTVNKYRNRLKKRYLYFDD